MTKEKKKYSRSVAVFMAVALLSAGWLPRCVADDKVPRATTTEEAASASTAASVEPAKAPAAEDRTKFKHKPAPAAKLREFLTKPSDKPSHYRTFD